MRSDFRQQKHSLAAAAWQSRVACSAHGRCERREEGLDGALEVQAPHSPTTARSRSSHSTLQDPPFSISVMTATHRRTLRRLPKQMCCHSPPKANGLGADSN